MKHMLLWLGLAAYGFTFANPSAAEEIKLNGHVFTLPAGFTLEAAAAPPLVERPITADFDEQGRLYVVDNPVDVVFTPEGERVFTTTFSQHPVVAAGTRAA